MQDLAPLANIWNTFHTLFQEWGEVVLAGGSVRDYLLGQPPKDYDIYVLRGNMPFIDKTVINTEIRGMLGRLHLEAADRHKPESNYPREVEVVETFKTEKIIESPDPRNAQVMVVPYKTAQELINLFDWNICMFGYDKTGLIAMEDINNVGQGKELKLHRMNFPASNLRRAYRFSEKFGMRIRNMDLARLTYSVFCETNEI